MKYTVFQNYAQSDGVKVDRVTLKPYKVCDISECNQEHISNRATQTYITNSEKALQKSLLLVAALENAAQCFENTTNPFLMKEEFVFMIKELRTNITMLVRGISQLNSHRQIARLLTKLKQRGTVKMIMGKIEEEKGKKKIWRF